MESREEDTYFRGLVSCRNDSMPNNEFVVIIT